MMLETKPAQMKVEALVRSNDFEITSKNCYLDDEK
jgi:hypothetical protein